MIAGTAQSESEIERLTLIAENGNKDAASKLGQHFNLVERNDEKAKYWYHKAATLGGQHEKDVYHSYVEALKDYESTSMMKK